MLISQISYLLNMVSGADKKISDEAKNRFIELEEVFKKVKDTVNY